MIKINLLPTKRKPAKKLTPMQQQLIIGALILLVSFGGMAFWWWNLYMRIDELKGMKADAEAKIAKQESMLKEVRNVEDEEKKVKEKLDIIAQLQANQANSVRVLDEISRLLPKGVGLTTLTENGGQVSLEGTAFTNNDLVGYIDALKGSSLFADVSLIESQLVKLEGYDVYKYKLQFRVKAASKGA